MEIALMGSVKRKAQNLIEGKKSMDIYVTPDDLSKPPKPITCGKCSSYSRSLVRCKLGKANPRIKRSTRDAMILFGASYICNHNQWKQELILDIARVRELGGMY